MNITNSKLVTCECIQTYLSSLADGELEQDKAEMVQRHLLDCSACSLEFAALQDVWNVLDEYQAPPLSNGFEQAVLARIKAKTSWWDDYRHHFLPLTTAVAAIGIILGGWLGTALVEVDGQNASGMADTMDIFNPSPKGSFTDGLLATLNDIGKTR